MKRTTLEVIAPSVEEAIARGVEQLGVPRELLNVDILDEGTKGFLGIGGRQVRLRLTLKAAGAAPQAGTAPAVETLAATSLLSVPIGDSLLSFTSQNTSELLAKMKIKATVSVRYGESDINGDDLSAVVLSPVRLITDELVAVVVVIPDATVTWLVKAVVPSD